LISIKKLKQEYQINDKKKAEEELFKIKNVLTHEEQGYSDDSNKNKNENTNLKQKRKIFNDSDDFDKDFDRKKRKTEMKIINPANTFGTISYGGSQERNINKFFFKHDNDNDNKNNGINNKYKNSYELITAFILNGFSLLWWLTFFIAYYFFQKKKNTDVNNLKSTLSALWINIVGVGNQPENCTNDNNNDTDDQQKKTNIT